jgi:hypothetical protein
VEIAPEAMFDAIGVNLFAEQDVGVVSHVVDFLDLSSRC